MNAHHRFVPLVCLALLAGCGAVNVSVKPQTTLTRNSIITLAVDSSDRLHMQEQLGRLLSERGFQVDYVPVVQAVMQGQPAAGGAAKSTTARLRGVAEFSGEGQMPGSLGTETDGKPTHTLAYGYHAYHDVFCWAFTDFTAAIMNSTTNEVMASADFAGDRSVGSVLEMFADKLASLTR